MTNDIMKFEQRLNDEYTDVLVQFIGKRRRRRLGREMLPGEKNQVRLIEFP